MKINIFERLKHAVSAVLIFSIFQIFKGVMVFFLQVFFPTKCLKICFCRSLTKHLNKPGINITAGPIQLCDS